MADAVFFKTFRTDLDHVVAVSYWLEFQTKEQTFDNTVFDSGYSSAFDAEHLSGFSGSYVYLFGKCCVFIIFTVAIRFACKGFCGLDTCHLEAGYDS